ncbi:MAG: TonB-dependent receptor [Flavobacteriaceae bacterium]
MKPLLTIAALGLLGTGLWAQNTKNSPNSQNLDTLQGAEVQLKEVFVSAVRANQKMGVTYSEVKAQDIAPVNLGQDLPFLIRWMPSVVTTSDAGTGIGYTGIRVRGSDATRVNVTINGVAYNDAESHSTYWVNLPDFASSVSSLQLQRGVGTSTQGPGAFGASLNLSTTQLAEQPYAVVQASAGSFATWRNNMSFSTGLIKDRWSLQGRLSRIVSDGYIDRASARLNAYFLQGGYQDENTKIQGLLFGGHEVTYQAWYGIDAFTLAENRRFNPAGAYTDDSGVLRFYDKQEDNYKQDHAQWLWYEDLPGDWSFNTTLHFTRGRGYYEEFQEDALLGDYGFTPEVTTDLVRRKWLDNRFYGANASMLRQRGREIVQFGAAASRYQGDHFGQVIWAQQAGNSHPRTPYYFYDALKTEWSAWSKYQWGLAEDWTGFVDLQYRGIRYNTQVDTGAVIDDAFGFFNPKFGLTWTADQGPNRLSEWYLSYAVAHREPNRTDYENGSPKPETLRDVEWGYRWATPEIQVQSNLFYMHYTDQLVLTGAIDEVGAPIRANVGRSYRTGWETQVNWSPNTQWSWQSSLSLSRHRNQSYREAWNGGVRTLNDTPIALSPEVVASSIWVWTPDPRTRIQLAAQHVGQQYLGNTASEVGHLPTYTQWDLVASKTFTPAYGPKTTLSAMVNNLLNRDLVTNGYYYTYEDTWSTPGTVTTVEGAGFYPQAGRNFLVGLEMAW